MLGQRNLFLTLPAENNLVLLKPVSVSRATNSLGEAMTLAKTTGFAVGGGLASHFSVLMNWVHDPLDVRISADRLVCRVDTDNLIVAECTVLTNPIGVQHTQSATPPTATFLSNCLGGPLVFKLIDTMICWLAICSSLRNGTLATTTTNSYSEDAKALLGFETKTPSTFWSGRASKSDDFVCLPKFPTL